MKKLLLLGGCLWALATQPARAQAGSADIVVVKVLESPLATHIVIARSSGFPDEYDIKASLGNEAAVARESAQKMQEVLRKLYEQGYAIRSAFGGGNGDHSTLVLVKGW